eukprot:7474993-Pyramimonas_sp.AAC.1
MTGYQPYMPNHAPGYPYPRFFFPNNTRVLFVELSCTMMSSVNNFGATGDTAPVSPIIRVCDSRAAESVAHSAER